VRPTKIEPKLEWAIIVRRNILVESVLDNIVFLHTFVIKSIGEIVEHNSLSVVFVLVDKNNRQTSCV